MPDDLYERDIVLWTEAQAALLRRLASGERVNADVDWPNVIEEIEALGRSERRATASLIRLALSHMMKVVLGGPDPERHWRQEIRSFLTDAQDAYTPAMRTLIEWDKLYDEARENAEFDFDAAGTLPAHSPFAPDDLIGQRPTPDHIDALIAKLRLP